MFVPLIVAGLFGEAESRSAGSCPLLMLLNSISVTTPVPGLIPSWLATGSWRVRGGSAPVGGVAALPSRRVTATMGRMTARSCALRSPAGAAPGTAVLRRWGSCSGLAVFLVPPAFIVALARVGGSSGAAGRHRRPPRPCSSSTCWSWRRGGPGGAAFGRVARYGPPLPRRPAARRARSHRRPPHRGTCGQARRRPGLARGRVQPAQAATRAPRGVRRVLLARPVNLAVYPLWWRLFRNHPAGRLARYR